MKGQEPNPVNYCGPPSKEPSPDGWAAYWIGMMIGCVTVIFYLLTGHDGSILEIVLLMLAGYLLTLPAGIIYALRRRNRQKRPSRSFRLFFPLVTLFFYPVAHLIFCKLVSFYRQDPRYVFRASPLSMVVPCIVIGAAATALTWKCQPLGRSATHWFVAGLIWPVAVIGIVAGMNYLQWSRLGSDLNSFSTFYFFCGVAVAAFAIPFIVSVTFTEPE